MRGSGLLSGGKPLPWAEQLGYPYLVRGVKAGFTPFIRALFKQNSPSAKMRKEKRTRFHLKNCWVFSTAMVAGLVPVHSTFAQESLTSYKGVQGPALDTSMDLYNTHTSLSEDDQNQPWRGRRMDRHLEQWDGVARPLTMDMKHDMQCQTRCVLSSIAVPVTGQPEPSPKRPLPSISHLLFPSFCHTPTLAAHALLGPFFPWLCASSGHKQWQIWVPPGWRLTSAGVPLSPAKCLGASHPG